MMAARSEKLYRAYARPASMMSDWIQHVQMPSASSYRLLPDETMHNEHTVNAILVLALC